MNLPSKRSTQLSIGTLAVSAISVLASPNMATAITMTYEAPGVFAANAILGATAVNGFEAGTVSTTPYCSQHFRFRLCGHWY